MKPCPSATTPTGDVHTSSFSPHAFDAIDHGALVERRPRHGGRGEDALRQHSQADGQPAPPLRISTRRLQVLSYVLAELSSATTLLPDYTKAFLNLSRRLIGAWQAVTAAAVARTRYEHALVWAAHHRWKSTEASGLRSSSRRKAPKGDRGFITTPCRSLRRRARDHKKRSSSGPSTAAAAASPLSASAGGVLLDPVASSHKRRRLTREPTSATASWNAAVETRRVGKPPTHADARRDDNIPAPHHVGSPTSFSQHPQADVAVTPSPPSRLDRHRSARHNRAAPTRHQYFVQMTLQQLWLDAQEAEDKAGQSVEYIRGLVINALYQQYLHVTVEASYHDLVLYRWLSPSLLGVCRGGAGARQTRSHRGCRHRHHSASVHQGGGSLWHARHHQAAVQVAADLRLLRCVLGRARIAGGPSPGAGGRGGGGGGSGVVVTSPAVGDISASHSQAPPSGVAAGGVAGGAVCAGDCASFTNIDGGADDARANNEGGDADAGAAPRSASADSSRSSSVLSPSDAFDDHALAVPMPLHSFLQACLSFDPTHCAFALMSRCVVLAQHVRSEDDERAVRLPVAPNGKGCRQGAQGGVSRASQGAAANVDGEETSQGYFGLFYVVIARRAVGACGCSAMCFGNHKFIFVRCHDTEALLREAMTEADSDEGASEGSEVSTAATVDEEELHLAHVSRVSVEAIAATPVPNEAREETDKLAGAGAQTQLSNSASSAAAMAAAIKGLRGRLSLSRLHAHSPQTNKLTLPARTGGISALRTHDAQRLKRDASEYSDSGERGLVEEEKRLRKAPSEVGTHAPLPSLTSARPSNRLNSTPPRQPHSPTVPFLPPVSIKVAPTATAAGHGSTFRAAAVPSSIAATPQWVRSANAQPPSAHVRWPSAQVFLTKQDHSSSGWVNAVVLGRASAAATTVPTSPTLTQRMFADVRHEVVSGSGASRQSHAARECSTPSLSPLTRELQEAAGAVPEDRAVAKEETMDAECSCAVLRPPHSDCSRYAVNGELSARCIASATHPISDSARLPFRTSSSATLASSSFSASALSGLDDDADDDVTDTIGRAHRLQQRHGRIVGFSNRVTEGDDERGAEGKGAAADDGDVLGDGGGTQVFVVVHSLLCSFGVDDTTKECVAAADRVTAESSPLTAAAVPDFFERGHSRQHEADTLLGDRTQGLSHLSSVLCAPHTDFSLSYFEQHVLLPPGSGHERRAGGGRRGDGAAKLARLRVPSIETGWWSSSPGSLLARGAELADRSFGHVGPRAQGPGTEAASAEHRVAGTARGADVPLVEDAALTPRNPQRDDLYDCAREITTTKQKGASSCHPPRASGATGASVLEPSEGDMAFAAELYARLQFWSLRGQDRSAYIDPSWSRQSRHRYHEEVKWRASSASHDLVGNTEDLEVRVEGNRQQPPSSLSGYLTGTDTSTGVQTGIGLATPGTETRGKPPSGARLRSSLHRSVNASETDEARNAVRLPFRLLHCTVGTIELADEAGLASPSAGMRARKRRRAANAEERQVKRQPSVMEGGDTTEEQSDESLTTEERKCDKGREHLLRLPPFMTVNARGKELLFEALREATEVVVCGVRESRSHTGYHDLLHQRCPPPPPSTLVSAGPPNKPGTRSGGDAPSAGYSPCSDSAAAASTGTPSKSTWLTTVNPWMAAATAAVQGHSFPVATGTLSRNERNPFAFDTHLHLGACGIVRWSQGDISHEEEAGDSPTDASCDQAVLAMAASTSGSASHAAEGTSGATHHHDHLHRSDSPHMPKWRWPTLPDNDYKQWRCELLKSEFRLARSRCLDCLLVDHTHGRPIAAMTLTPQAWPQASFDSALDAVYDDDDGADEEMQSRRCPERHPSDAEATESLSPQEVVQRTVYVVTGFTHYVAPLWRHLREEKAVLVDMDRTLIDNAITVRSAAERQRHFRHLRRVMAVAEGVAGTSNPCLLWHRHTTEPSSAFFAGALPRLGRNDAPRLTEEELAEAMVRGVDEEQEDVLCHGSRARQRYSDRIFFSARNLTETVEDDGVLRPTIRQRPLHNGESAAADTSSSTGGLLHRFMRRTVSQRQSLGIVHYEECGAVQYAAGPLSASGPDLAADASPKSSRNARVRSCAPSADEDAFRSNSARSVTTAAAATVTPPARCFFDVVYVRPGARQLLYRAATQWNIPLVLVTKSTRGRTEAILRQVLDPHRVLFPDMQTNVVTADEMLRWHDEEAMPSAVVGREEGTREEPIIGLADPGGRMPVLHSSSAASGVPHTDHVCLVPLNTVAPTSTAERIARCRKCALRVVQFTLDAAAMMAARRAWRAPAWCDWLNRLPKPRSIAVVDDAPQVWEVSDWPCTVRVSPYTLARVDPRAYFSRRGYVTSLVLSCLYGSKCLVCSEGVLRLPERQEAEASPSSSSLYTPSASLSTRESPGIGPYRWPHCVCVCLPDHLRDVSRAEEDAPAGYFGSSHGAAASDLSASVSAMLTALLWRISNKAALHSSQQPLMLPAVEDSAVTRLADRARGVGGQVGARRRGGGCRRRRPFHTDNLGATMTPVSEGFSALSATAESEGRRETTCLATSTPAAASRQIGWGGRLRHLDADAFDVAASSPLPSHPVFAGAAGHTFAYASASARSASASSSASTSSPSLSTSASSLSSVPFAWGGRFLHAMVNPTRDTRSNTPSTITAASIPPTPLAFHATPEPWLESKALGGEVEGDAGEQQTLPISTRTLGADATLSGTATEGEEGFLLRAPGPRGDTASSTIRGGAPRSSSFDEDDVIPFEMGATQSMPEPLCALWGPSHSIDDLGGGHSVASIDLASLSAGSHKASWVSRSATSVPAEDVVPVSSVPEGFAERLVTDVNEPVLLEVCEAELQSPWRRRLDNPCDEVEDVTPL